MRKLNYICRVQRVLLNELPFKTLLGNKTFSLPGSDSWDEVKCLRPVKLEITDKIEDGLRLYTHKLTFRTCEEDINVRDVFAYLVTDLDGKKYLIGSGERPYPIINISDVHPDSYASSTMTEVSVQWISMRKAPKIR